MLELSIIKDTVMNVAEAITAALEIETEIIDNSLKIIAGTGRYAEKIGSLEEQGDLNSGEIYGKLLKIGRNYICTDAQSDVEYGAREGELAEISCPIKSEGKVIGLIGLVAFTGDQREKIIKKSDTLTLFLERMADLIASKLSETEKRNQIKGILESMHEGLIALDRNGIVMSCNFQAGLLLGQERQKIEQQSLDRIWPMKEAANVIRRGAPIKDKEILYESPMGQAKRFLCSIIPLDAETGEKSRQGNSGAMILFQDISDARARIYRMTADDKITTFEDITGNSEIMRRIKSRTLQVAPSDSTVLITGESGTGKELFARAIHCASPRRDHPFIAINCGAIPDMLLESELFGYERGAFTGADTGGKLGKFELAHKGTIFLDEIGDMPLHLQVKLLHAIQNRQIERVGGIKPIDIDVRIIAATNKNLEEMIAAKEFREDLFFRLNVIPLNIPPLRERSEDIELLLHSSLTKFNPIMSKQIAGFHPMAMEALLQYRWPGNVRELENVVEYAVNMETGPEIRLENLPHRVTDNTNKGNSVGWNLQEKLDEWQSRFIKECLNVTGRSTEGKAAAAKLLGISESTLYRRLRELGIH